MAEKFGFAPYDSQRLLLRDWLATREDGLWAASRVGLSKPRQNGKNAVIEMRELYGMAVLGEKIMHTAHEVKSCRAAFERLQWFFGSKKNDPNAQFPELNRLVERVRHVNGAESIFLSNGGSVQFVARTPNSGRGFTVDVLVLDEAQDLTDAEHEAQRPVVSAAPLGNPQIIFTGTPPAPEMDGGVFSRMRAEAVSENPGARLTWAEYSAAPGCDPANPAAWAESNPLMGHRLSYETISDEQASMSQAGFMRERLGMWDALTGGLEVIPAEDFAACADMESIVQGVPITFAVDVSPRRDVATVAFAAEREDGRWHVEIDNTRAGSAWVVPWILTRIAGGNKVAAVMIDGGGPAAPLIDALKSAKVKVNVTGANDMGRACGGFYDAVYSGQLVHTDQPQLNIALSLARKRNIGASGLWGWSRSEDGSDITPLVASTLALYGARNPKLAPRKRTASKVRIL